MANVTVSPEMGIALQLLEDYGSLFYIVDPRKTIFTSLEDIPNYTTRAYPFFILHIIIESVVLYMSAKRDETEAHQHDKKKASMAASKPQLHKKLLHSTRLNDAISSISAGMIQQVTKIFTKGLELSAYVYIFDHFRVMDVDQTSPWVWGLAYLGVDLGYYLFHRGAHEINLFWATHIVHHSSEEYNQTTALRQSAFQHYISWMYYLPLAFILPPPMFVVHGSFNTLYQFWIHTETIPRLGFLEYILNTPSAHRVHHGRNPYCIDKNYAGTLIIWDRLFGTYQEELETEPVLFGLTHNIQSFDPLWIQFHHFHHVFKTCWNTPGLGHKLAVLFAGPGWSPEKPHLRFGDFNDIPAVPNLAENPNADIGGKTVAAFAAIYVLLQFITTLICQMSFMHFQADLPMIPKMVSAAYVIFSLWVLGLFLDGKNASLVLEIARLGVVSPAVAAYLVSAAGDPIVATPGGLVGVVASYAAISLSMLVGMLAVDRILPKAKTPLIDPVKAKEDSKTFSSIAIVEMWRAPVFQFHDGQLLWKLMLASSSASGDSSNLGPPPPPIVLKSGAVEQNDVVSDGLSASFTSSSSQSTNVEDDAPASLYLPYFAYVKELDLRRLSRPPLDVADPAPAWISATRLALRLASYCPNLLSVKLDGWPPDVTGSTFASLLCSLPETIEHIMWTRVAVSDLHLSRMAGRWPRLKTLRIGIVTPFMWGVRSILAATDGPNTQAIGQALGGTRGTESFGFARLLQRCPRIEVLGIEPLPGDDGTAWLLEVLSLHAPPSLRKVELGRGRYLMSTQFSAKRVWRAFFEFVVRSQINRAIVVDHFYSIRTASPGLWILTENYLNSSSANANGLPNAMGISSTVSSLTSQAVALAQQQSNGLQGGSNPFLQSLGVPGNELQGRFGSVVVFGSRGIDIVRKLATELGVDAARSLFFHS
ncbi:hypothetical protein HDU67_005965 [Dinochytrium kinnereticum]|nr:hypothetical protein HDU67_005965 [Dinochytrium kinnereticum]